MSARPSWHKPIHAAAPRPVRNATGASRAIPSIRVLASALAASGIAIGLLSGVAMLFQSDGTPGAQVTAADHACSAHAYTSDRKSCVREWLAGRAPRSRVTS